MIVLGIDPGVSNTGYGVVQVVGQQLFALDGGVLKTSAADALESRLCQIFDRITSLIAEHGPDAVAVESIYFGRNVESAFAVGQARGAVLTAAGRSGVPVTSYTPQQIKKSVCGTGRAEKIQVQQMVAALLKLDGPLPADHAADALAVGICHANQAPYGSAVATAMASA